MMSVQHVSAQRSGLLKEAPKTDHASTNAKETDMHPQAESVERPMHETGLGSVPKKDIYTYAEASEEFNEAKAAKERDAYKQFMVGDTQLNAETIKTKNGATLTRYETGAILKEEDKKPIIITTPSGFVIESELMTKDDVQEELADVAKVVKEQNPDTKNLNQSIATQFEHDLAEAEIWGKTLKDPDDVKIDPKTENIDVSTPTGVFHLNKKDEITFDRADGATSISLKQVLKEGDRETASVREPKVGEVRPDIEKAQPIKKG